MNLTQSPTLINNRYQLHEQLGSGGMGVVFRATDRLNGQAVALKQLTQVAPGFEDDTARALSLTREFKTLAGLRHPHIVSVLDYGFDEHYRPFFTMHFLEDAQNILEAGQERPLDSQIDLLLQLLQALALSRQIGDRKEEVDCLMHLGLICGQQDDRAEARNYFQQGVELYRQMGNRRAEAEALYNIGIITAYEGEYDDARKSLELSLDLGRKHGIQKSEASALLGLGFILYNQGNYGDARRHLEMFLARSHYALMWRAWQTRQANMKNNH